MSASVLRQAELLAVVFGYQRGLYEEFVSVVAVWKRQQYDNQRAACILLLYEGTSWLARLLRCKPAVDTKALMDQAASNGHLVLVDFLHHHGRAGCSKHAMDSAARNGHLAVVEFLHRNRREGCMRTTMDHAAMNGHLHIVHFLHDNRLEGCTTNAIDFAARNGHLDVVKFLVRCRHEGCSSLAMTFAARDGHLEVVQFLLQVVGAAGIFEALSTASVHDQKPVVAYLQRAIEDIVCGSPFALARVRQASSEALDELLQSTGASSLELVVAPRLWSLFQHFSTLGSDRLKALHVTEIHALDSHDGGIHNAHSALVFLVQPCVPQIFLVARRIADVVAQLPPRTTPLQCYIFHTGQWSALCAEVLLQEKVADMVDLTLQPLALGFIPIDSDLLTMGTDTLLRECYLGCNKTGLVNMALALHTLQHTVGNIGHIFYKGELSKCVWKSLAQFNAQRGTPPPPSTKHRIDCMILLDRKLDYFAPLSTPLTYEGLLGELLGYRDGMVQVDANLLDDAIPPNQQLAPMSLSSDDVVFQACRNVHVQALSPFLHSQVAQLSAEHDTLQKAMAEDAVSISDISTLPGQVKEHLHRQALLNQHLQLSQQLQETTNSKTFRRRWFLERAIMEGEQRLGDIEQLVWKHAPLLVVLRLLGLHSLVNGGIPRHLYYHLKTQIMQFYGYEYLHTFENLERMGLLGVQGSTGPNLLKAFDAVGHYGSDVVNPADASYVSGGFTPLVVKLVEAALGPRQWEPIADLLNQLPGPSAHFATTEGDGPVKRFKKVLVVVVGSVSLLEVAALRFLGAQRKCTFLIASNAITSGGQFLDPILEVVYNGLADDHDIK
ncbi:vacuolar protein sorting-associated protein 33A [Achlya hypogyna]|uniref:Vacuolar protein sorting-associated protein 33A n=1 Tax=Achlya hypogyna TaxID=1202772 RepID=A0A1V9Y672_ACHHY|nr:vacuolar protein sorting-associated protein 33A [Achlya hypogyna]